MTNSFTWRMVKRYVCESAQGNVWHSLGSTSFLANTLRLIVCYCEQLEPLHYNLLARINEVVIVQS